MPVVSGYALECLRIVGNSDDARGLASGSVAIVALPQHDTVTEAGMSDVLETVRQTKADLLVLPGNAAVNRLAIESEQSAKPLTRILGAFKQDKLTVASATGDASLPELYHVLRPYEIAAADAEELKDCLDLLATRFPSLTPGATVLETSQQVRELAKQLRPLALRSISDHLENEISFGRDDEAQPMRTRLSRFTIPAVDDDPFSPSVWVQYGVNPNGVPAERRSLASFVSDTFDLGSAVRAQSITSMEVLPVIGEALRKLAHLDMQLQATEDRSTVENRQELLVTAPALVRVAPARESPHWRSSFKQIVGFTALAATVLTGTSYVSMARPSSNNTIQYVTEASGQATTITEPTWRLEENGMDTDGYYPTLKYYQLADGLQWQDIDDDRERLELPTDVGLEPHVAVTGYFADQTADDIFLPVKQGTELGAIRVTEAGGSEVGFDLYEAGDGSTSLMLDDQPSRAVRIEYDLVATSDTNGASYDMTIEGLQHLDVREGDTTESLLMTAESIADTYAYDNTDKLVDMVSSAQSAPDFFERSRRAQIGNCKSVATTLAIGQELYDADDKLAFTAGYRGEGKYLRQPHAWLTNYAGTVIDGTPNLNGRTATEVGLLSLTEADEEAAWNRATHAFEADKSPRLPIEHVPSGLLGSLALGLVAHRLRYGMRELSARIASRHLSEGQAHHVIAHAAFGDPSDVPQLKRDEAILSLGSLPYHAAIDAAAHPGRVAPYLSRKQRRALRRHARLILAQHVE